MSIGTLLEVPPIGEGASEPDFPYEIVDGEIREKIVSAREAGVAARISEKISVFASPRNLGRVYPETLFRFGDNVPQRRPDMSYVSFARWPEDRSLPVETAWKFVPDLVIEVISPNDLEVEIVGKTNEYFAAGVQQVWEVWAFVRQVRVYDSRKSITIYDDGDEIDAGKVIPGLRLTIGEVFGKEAP